MGFDAFQMYFGVQQSSSVPIKTGSLVLKPEGLCWILKQYKYQDKGGIF